VPIFRRLLAVLFLIAFAGAAFASTPKLTDYPLRVHIYHEHWGTEYYGGGWGYYPTGYHGYGEANLIDGNQVNGMKFTFECSDHFTHSDGGTAYPARWKKQGRELELIAQIVGSDSIHKCIMKTTVLDYIYSRHDGELVTLTQEQFQRLQAKAAEHDASLAPKDTDVSHYPLKLTILNVNWQGRTSGIWSGMGQGNVATPSGLQAVDFSISCISEIPVNPVGRYYRGKWLQADSTSKMTLLLHKMSDPTVAATCDLNTVVHSDVYIRRSTGDLQAVSPQDYKNFEQAVVAAPGKN
jgi:hypothetical protein